jgi:hypothetical protein
MGEKSFKLDIRSHPPLKNIEEVEDSLKLIGKSVEGHSREKP